nr:NADPH-dependent aldehyde reductase 1, chloroplastic-like [Tanacetum cinerariifolium]
MRSDELYKFSVGTLTRLGISLNDITKNIRMNQNRKNLPRDIPLDNVEVLREKGHWTGGDSGIGRAVCYCFAKEGETIAFTYVKGDEDKDAEDILNIINESKISDSSDPIAIPVDLGYEKNCKNVIDEVVGKSGCIVVLVNNAAEQHYTHSLDEIMEERLERVCCEALKERSSIINSTSVLAYTGSPKWLDYSSTKGDIVSFTRGLALHLVHKGIRVNAVGPGPVWTPLQPTSKDEHDTSMFGSNEPMESGKMSSQNVSATTCRSRMYCLRSCDLLESKLPIPAKFLPALSDFSQDFSIRLGQDGSGGFPAQSVGSSNTEVLDSPCLLVLIIGTSQSRQHVITSSIHIEFRKSPTKSLFDVGSSRISIFTMSTFVSLGCSGKFSREMRRTLYYNM